MVPRSTVLAAKAAGATVVVSVRTATAVAMDSRAMAATATAGRASALRASRPTAVTAWTAHHGKIVDRVKSANPAPSASRDPTPIWAACASASPAPALPRREVNLIRCAPASMPCARATAAAKAAVEVVVAGVAPARVARAARPILCGRASAGSGNRLPPAPLRVTPLEGGRCLGPAEPDLRHLWIRHFAPEAGWSTSRTP